MQFKDINFLRVKIMLDTVNTCNAIIREKFDLPLLDRLIGVSTFLSKSDVCIEMHQSNEAHRTSVWD